jgi:hypothetical protein
MAKTAAKVVKQFGAYVKVTLDLFVEVEGTTLEEALANARTIKPHDPVGFGDGVDYNDGEIVLSGVMER